METKRSELYKKNKMLNEDTDKFYIYFDHPIMEDMEFIDDDDVSVEEVDVQEVSAKNDGVDNDADVESLDSDDGYESTEDALYKPPPSGYGFLDSSEEEESVGAGKKGKNNGKKKFSMKTLHKKSKVSKHVNGPVGKDNSKSKRTRIRREELEICDNMFRFQVTQPEAPTNATIPDVGMNVNAATGRQTQPQQPFRRLKQTIIRPKSQESVSAKTMAAASSGTTSRMFKFIPTPGLNLSKKK
ncbi:uncharacterized protein DS421_2g36180 [Arachis hypogaea]|nr:uncharacterized protein DS421_2g36180 [Arachis hypogaea]